MMRQIARRKGGATDHLEKVSCKDGCETRRKFFPFFPWYKKYKANETHLPLEKQTIHKRPLIKEKKQIRLSPIKDKAKKKIPK